MDKFPRAIDVLLFDDINLLDVAGPIQAFKEATVGGKSAYQVRFVIYRPQLSECAQSHRHDAKAQPPGAASFDEHSAEQHSLNNDPLQVITSCQLAVRADALAQGDSQASDLLIPGGDGIDSLLGDAGLQRLVQHWCTERTDARLISICSGALLLADAGVLDGRVATTHWAREAQALAQYPNVNWQLNRILANDDHLYTSAGVTTGIDLALSLIRRDCGARTALSVARELVVSLKRSGGQKQFAPIIEWQFSAHDSISPLVTALVERPEKPWTLDLMAASVSLTPRTLSRRFNHNFNTSPMKFLEHIRVGLATDLLSAGIPLERVTRQVGFSDVQTLRRACKRQLGTTIGDYLKQFSDTQPEHTHTL